MADAGRVFVATRDGTVRALDALTGSTAWSLAGHPGWLGAEPGLLILRQEDGRVVSLDPVTGSVRWSSASGIRGALAPVVNGDLILVAGEGLAALDASAGHVVWSFPGAPEVTAPPVSLANRVFVGEEDGTLRCRDRASGRSLWEHRTSRALRAPPILDGPSRLLVGTTDRAFVALSLDKGRQRWRWKVGAEVDAPAAVLGDNVIVACQDAVLYALKKGNGNMVWRTPLPSRPLCGPILVGGSIVVACRESDLWSLDVQTGKRLTATKTPGEMRTAPLIVGDELYVALKDPKVVLALDLTRQPPPPPSPTPQPPASPSPSPSTPPVGASPSPGQPPDDR